MAESIVKKGYDFILNQQCFSDPHSLLRRTVVIEWLEKEIGCKFRNTEEFHQKVKNFLLSEKSTGEKLKEARKKKGWSQHTLGLHLSVSKQYIKEIELNRKPLNKKALQFLSRFYDEIPLHA